MNHPDEVETMLLSHVILVFNKIKRLLLKKFPNDNGNSFEIIIKNCSSKLVRLLTILEMEYEELCKDNKKLHCIIFVERRTTAIVLAHILKTVRALNPKLEFISCECVIGGEKTHTLETHEHSQMKIKSDEVLKKYVMREEKNRSKKKKEDFNYFFLICRFRAEELNVLVATNIVEEGVDIPKCNLVIYFDKPTNYRSYVQSKGRARDRFSKYYILIEEDEADGFSTKIQNFRKMELFLRQVKNFECIKLVLWKMK